MKGVKILNREIAPDELAHMKRGFDAHTIDNDVEVQTANRHGFTAEADGVFIGCSSGLAYMNGAQCSGWFYLTDLFVEKPYRRGGLGAQLLTALENDIREVGVKYIWTWTAGYEAPGFYLKQGYVVFTEMENWYSDGSSRVGLRKQL